MEIVSSTASSRTDVCLSVWSDWNEYETSAFLLVATPPVYAYHSYEERSDGPALVRENAVAGNNNKNSHWFITNQPWTTQFEIALRITYIQVKTPIPNILKKYSNYVESKWHENFVPK